MVKPMILHITPHMGGGVGNVISGIAASSENLATHRILLLEQPIDGKFLQIALDAGTEVSIMPGGALLTQWIDKSDITIMHWWNHPRTAKLLCRYPRVASRVVLWSHVSNLTVPALSPQMLREAAMVWFTSPASYEARVFAALPREVVEKKTGLVYGCPGMDHFPATQPEEHQGFTVGYLGYVDFTKLHPDFISFCQAVGLPEAKFIVAGDGPAKETLIKQAKRRKLKNEFVYTGYVANIYEIFSSFDVFGYPLMSSHTGTTENALLEAMAAKVPPVALNQLSEKYIIKNGETGFLVSGREEYGSAIRYLHNHPEKRKRMGAQAREHVLKKYAGENMLRCFYANVEKAMRQPKKRVNFKAVMGGTPGEWFASSLGEDSPGFRQSLLAGCRGQTPEIKESILNCSPLIKGKNKSSVFHYAREFPGDPMLKVWANIIKEAGKSDGE